MEYFVEPLVLRIASSAKQIKVAHESGLDNCCFVVRIYFIIFISIIDGESCCASEDDNGDVRGSSVLQVLSYTTHATRPMNKAPRYHFDDKDDSAKATRSSMGPPPGPPRSLKLKTITNSTSSKIESSSSGRVRPRVLASDSAALETSHDFCTPKNRPAALRYISSSSRGGHSGSRSARSTSSIFVERSVILAISEGRGMARGEIGIAAIDLRHPYLVLCQFSDTLLYTHTLTKINFFNPVEIIVPHTFCEGVQPNQLYQLIKDQYPQVNLTTVQRRHFNDAVGLQNIQTLCAPQYSAVYLQVLHKFYALTAAAAVLKYVEYIQCIVFARESLKIEYNSSENTMIIDVGTATQLELVQPLVPSAGPSCCLLGVLGPLYTHGGIRALRASILQPSCDKEFIEKRLDAVQDLIDNESGLMVDVQDAIKKLSEIDKILFLCVESTNQNMDKMGEAQLNQTILLKTTMDMVPKLIDSLKAADSGRLKYIKKDFENPNYIEIADRIRKIIQDDAHLERGPMGNLQRCFAVKPNINGLLDVARRTYSELIEDIQKIVEQLSENYDLPLRLNQNVMKGFHIVLPIAPKNRRHFNADDLPTIFIQVKNNGASVTMTTEELVVLDQQAKESLNEIQKMSNIVISSLLKELRPFMSSLYKLCEDVAELDILVALAQASTIGSYVRPRFADYLDLRNSVHPLLDYNSQVMPVPNDVYASPEKNFTIITGPNMGGKSIYIKQIAILQVMAQLGCFLPATNAVLRISNRIFSRIGFNDSVELNASTFVYEMKEMQHILKGLTKSSLVIIDELCRGTSDEEGTSLAWAICEELILSDSFTFFTTHFHYITRLQDLYYNVVNRYTVVNEEEIENTQNPQRRLIYTHKIEVGINPTKNYGLALAAKTNMPEDTVKLAYELSELIVQNETPQEIRTLEINDEKMLYDLNSEIKLARRQGNSDEAIKQSFYKFKIENQLLIEKLQAQKINDRTDSSAKDTPTNSRRESSFNLAIAMTPDRFSHSDEVSSYGIPSVIEPSESDDNGKKLYNERQHPVKFSTELLNSIMFLDKRSNGDQIEIAGLDNEPMSENDRGSINMHDNTVNDNDGNSDPKFVESARSSIEMEVDEPTTIIRYMNSPNNSNKTQKMQDFECIGNIQHDHNSSNTNIADALTQVIEEFSVENQSMSNDTMSLDEEFISDVVNEINEELTSGTGNIDHIVLTPPVGFRDE